MNFLPFPFLLILWLMIGGSTVWAHQDLQFSDEFKETSLDPVDWTIENRPGGQHGDKPELQFYQPSALTLSDGLLHISAEKIVGVAPTAKPTTYISGRIQSKRAFLYGRFEFRVRLPKGKGLWSAIGLRTDSTLPLTSEIDVLQGFGSAPNLVESALHFWTNKEDPRQYAAFLVVQPKPDNPRFHREGIERVDKLFNLPRDLSGDFHVYAIDWQPDHLSWTFDGVPYYTIHERIPKDPMVLIIRLAVGGAGDGKPEATNTWPQSLDLDYVRVWSVTR